MKGLIIEANGIKEIELQSNYSLVDGVKFNNAEPIMFGAEIGFNIFNEVHTNMRLLNDVSEFHNIFDISSLDALFDGEDVYTEEWNLLYIYNGSMHYSERKTIGDIKSLAVEYKTNPRAFMYTFKDKPTYGLYRALSNVVSKQGNVWNNGYIKQSDIITINSFIDLSAGLKADSNTNIAIPEALKGQFGLIGICLFLQLTDKMDHCGFVYINNTLHCVNTIIHSQNRANNKVAYILEQGARDHNYPQDFVISYDSDIFVPFEYAKDLDLDIMINECGDSNVISNIDNLCFDKVVGYYDGDTHYIYEGDLHELEESSTLRNGDIVPSDDAVYCEHSGEYELLSDCTELHDGDYALDSDCVHVHGHGYYLDNDESITSCDDCDVSIHNEDSYYNEDTDETYCDSCRGNHSENMGGDLYRLSYDTDVLNHKGYGVTSLFINKKPVYVGLELETLVESSGEADVNKFSHECRYAVPTKDGSLDDDLGLEYIFRPEGLNQQKENVNDLIDNIKGCLENQEEDDYNADYGLHVHVSSHFLGFASKLKIQKFVSRNATVIRKHIGKRDATGYQKSHHQDKFAKLNHERYHMVNINPLNTIEFRFPAGIINKRHINLNLEFAQAVTMFCKFDLNILTLKASSKASWKHFCNYVHDNKDKYPLLNDMVAVLFIDKLLEKENETESCEMQQLAIAV